MDISVIVSGYHCSFHFQARQAELKSILEQRAAAVSSPQQQQQEMVAAHEMLAKQQVSEFT